MDGTDHAIEMRLHRRWRTGTRTLPVAVRALALHAVKRAERVSRPAGSTSWLILHFHSPGFIGSGADERPAPAGSIVVWAASEAQRYGWRGVCDHSWLHATGAQLTAWTRELALPTARPIPEFSERHTAHALVEIAEELDRDDRDGAVVANAVHTLLRHIGRTAGMAGIGAAAGDPLADLREYIDGHYHEPLRLAQLARRCGWSVGHLCARFQQQFGVGAYEYILRLRLQQARLLLADPRRTVAEVAQQLGWRDVRAFSRLVRKRMGLAPGEWRR